MRLVALVAAMTIAVAACGKEAAAPAPSSASVAPKPLDASVIPSEIRVLVARTARKQTEKAGAAFERWINERTAPRKVAVTLIETPEDALIRDLLAGKGDVAAGVLLTFERDDQVAFAKPLVTGIREVIVTGPKEAALVSLEDVGGRRIHVRKASDHFSSLMRLNEQLQKIARPPAKIVIAPAAQTDQELIEQVNAGAIPATLAYDYEFTSCCSTLPGVKVNHEVAVSQDGSLSWVTRKDEPGLLAFLNEYFSTHHDRPGAP